MSSPSPQKINIRKEAERIALLIREQVERENQMSIEKKRRGEYHPEIPVSDYNEQHEESIGSLTQRTDNVIQTDMPKSIHRQNVFSGDSSPTVMKNFSANVSVGQADLEEYRTIYQTNPNHYQVSQSHNPCTENGCSPQREMIHCTSMLQEGEIEDEPEPRHASPTKAA